MKDDPSKSPSLLRKPPKHDATGRRLNNKPLWIGGGAVAIVATLIAYTAHERSVTAQEQAEQTKALPSPADPSSILANAPKSGPIQPAVFQVPVTPTKTPAPAAVPPTPPSPAAKPAPTVQATPTDDDTELKRRKAAWDGYYATVAQLEHDRLEAAKSALTAETPVGAGSGEAGAAPVSGGGAGASPTPRPSASGFGGPAGVPLTMPPGFLPPAAVDVRGQHDKQDFLNQAGDLGGNDDLLTLKQPPKPDTIMAGTMIPGVMDMAINSDMPGHIRAHVLAPVYDTATGGDLLIPAGSTLLGEYDNQVSAGQTRIGVIWTRVIFPDTTSINLGAMEGADEGGQAGFHDQVDTHFWSKIGNAILISIAGAAVQLSQPPPPVNGTYSSTSIAAASIGQQFSQLGSEYARAGLSVPNTLEIRPGYQFTVFVHKDIHLPPYVDQRSGLVPVSLGSVIQ